MEYKEEERPCIIFHFFEDKVNIVKSFNVEILGNNNFDINSKIFIDDKYFTKIKDKFKTYINLFINGKQYKFLITLYYGENHITIFKSSNIGVCYEIINIPTKETKELLNEITFNYSKKNVLKLNIFDSLGNNLRRRFLIVNSPKEVLIKINKSKIESNLSYKITILPKDIILQKIKESTESKKYLMNNREKMKKIQNKIQNILKMKFTKNIIFDKELEKIILDDILNIKDELKPYYEYFNQNLINKEEEIWDSEEFISFYNYYIFNLILNAINHNDVQINDYYNSSLELFYNIFNKLNKINDVTYYEKICSITSLYIKLKSDCENNENKNHELGEYELINLNENNINCYKLAINFLLEIIKQLKENSYIFLPLLQVNSGFSKNLNTDKELEMLELSMLNVQMIKNHLNSLIPKLIFIIRHPNIIKKRSSVNKLTGTIFIYEKSLFNNNIGKNIKTIINKHSEDAAVIISFVLLNEIFIHKKLRENCEFIKGRETPSKFIGPKYDIKNFYFTNQKNNKDYL